MEFVDFIKEFGGDYERKRCLLFQYERIKNDGYIDFLTQYFPEMLLKYRAKILLDQKFD